MSQEDGQGEEHGYTRRSFLTRLSLGLAGLAGASFLLRGLLPGGKVDPGSGEGEFHGEESIFHPRRDPRLDSAERRWKT